MGRDREGRVGGAVAAQAVLSMARAGLEPRRQPDDQRHDQGPLARGAGGGGSGGIILRRHCEEHQRRNNLHLSTTRDGRRRLLCTARKEDMPYFAASKHSCKPNDNTKRAAKNGKKA